MLYGIFNEQLKGCGNYIIVPVIVYINIYDQIFLETDLQEKKVRLNKIQFGFEFHQSLFLMINKISIDFTELFNKNDR